MWDIRARDPKLLVFLKAYRNTVPVPRHWSQKRKYLQGKRGIEKPPFELPSFIQDTGALPVVVAHVYGCLPLSHTLLPNSSVWSNVERMLVRRH